MYKHVVIRPNERGGMEINVDGTDVSRFVQDTGVTVEIVHGIAHVTLPVLPVMFSGVFPEAVVNALSGPSGVMLDWTEVGAVLNALARPLGHTLSFEEKRIYDRLSLAHAEWITADLTEARNG